MSIKGVSSDTLVAVAVAPAPVKVEDKCTFKLKLPVCVLVDGNVLSQSETQEANKDKVEGRISWRRAGSGNLFSSLFYIRDFFKAPALSSDSGGAVARIHRGYPAVLSSTNDCQNILPMQAAR